MLLRQFHEFLCEAETRVPAAYMQKGRQMRERLEQSQRFVFSESACLACRQLAEHPEPLRSAQSQIFAPFPDLWLEFPSSLTPLGVRVSEGFLWLGDDKEGGLRRGGLVFVGWMRDCDQPVIIPSWIDLDRENPIKMLGEFATNGATQDGRKPDTIVRESLPEMLNWVLAGWALLATVGMTKTVQVDTSRINKSRAQRGLYPLLAYTEIRLDLDAERAVRAKDRVEAVSTGHMPLHPVRAHLRLLPTGKVTIVRAHMRGNPEHGIKSHHYTVTRAEDAA